ncbi:MAG TPA: hypothetical protein VN577_17010 [Terriglobales bacterium]|nr:hypothetical protein [Terriglobales bacterium]
MFIKALYVLLVLCLIALVGAVAAAYVKIRRHMKDSTKNPEGAVSQMHHETPPGTRTGS